VAAVPEINDLVELRDADRRTYRSRVEDVSARGLVIAQPWDLALTQLPTPGRTFELCWADDEGITVLPVELVRTEVSGRVSVWRLAITGAPTREQRRAYVRVSAVVPIRIVRPSADVVYIGRRGGGTGRYAEPATAEGQVIDISEAAVRCEVAPSVTWLGENAPVSAQFDLGEDRFTLPGHVLSNQPGNGRVQRRIVVEFDQPVPQARALRKQVFALETSSRRVD
jgi:hypothetical protein